MSLKENDIFYEHQEEIKNQPKEKTIWNEIEDMLRSLRPNKRHLQTIEEEKGDLRE